MVSRILALLVLAAALPAATAGAAGADTLIAAAPGARNLTANGGYLVWAAPDGARWRLTVRAPDGTVEAVRVEGAQAFACGVQWHPEYWAASDAPSVAIFRAFGEAARRRMTERPGGRLRDAAE